MNIVYIPLNIYFFKCLRISVTNGQIIQTGIVQNLKLNQNDSVFLGFGPLRIRMADRVPTKLSAGRGWPFEEI